MEFNKPTTVTDSSGHELTIRSTGQGFIVSNGSRDVITIGYGKDQSIGFSFRDASNERIFMGEDVNGNVFFKFSQAGYDAKTAADSNLTMSSTFNLPKILSTSTIDVTRTGGVDTGRNTIATGIINAPAFICFVYNTSASPQLTHQTPFISWNTTTGVINKVRRALYDPSTGVVKFLVESTSADPLFGTGETWRFKYYLFVESIQ